MSKITTQTELYLSKLGTVNNDAIPCHTHDQVTEVSQDVVVHLLLQLVVAA